MYHNVFMVPEEDEEEEDAEEEDAEEEDVEEEDVEEVYDVMMMEDEDGDVEEVTYDTTYSPSQLVHTWRQPSTADYTDVPSFKKFYNSLTDTSDSTAQGYDQDSYSTVVNQFVPTYATTPEQKNEAVNKLNDLMGNLWGY